MAGAPRVPAARERARVPDRDAARLAGAPPEQAAGLGLHDAALALLGSPSQKARTFAIEYARAHATDLDPERLAALLDSEHKDTRAFAASALQGKSPRALGHAFLGRLLTHSETEAWAGKALSESFDRAELPEGFLIDMLYGESEQKKWAAAYFKAKYRPGEPGAGFWVRVLDDPRHEDDYQATRSALDALGKYPIAAIGTPWLLGALARKRLGSTVATWLQKADALPDLTAEGVERLKGLVFSAGTRAVALEVLGNPKIVSPRQLTLPWLLALARRADPTLNGFARRYLLSHMKPQDFDARAGRERPRRPRGGHREAVRARARRGARADARVRADVPALPPPRPRARAERGQGARAEAGAQAGRVHRRADLARALRQAGRCPALRRAHHARRAPGVGLPDPRLRARAQRREGGAQHRLRRAPQGRRSVGRSGDRAHAGGARSGAGLRAHGEPEEERARARPLAHPEALRAARRPRAPRLADAERRPRGAPLRRADALGEAPAARSAAGLAAARARGDDARPAAELPEDAGRFADVEALRRFLRYVLSGIPAGRSPEPGDDAGSRRRLSASEAKRHVIEVVRDLAVEDAAFAALVAPVIAEFTGSIAKGEWQACLAALLRLRHAHPGLGIEGLEAAGDGQALPSVGQETA